MCICLFVCIRVCDSCYIKCSHCFRLHYAIQAYKELLEYVQYMGESLDDALRSNATIMKNNILYRPEYRDIFVTVIRNYNEVVSSRALLRDLVETVHIYLRLVEQLCKKKGRVLVQGKRKKRGTGSRKKSRKETDNDPVVLSTDQVRDTVCTIRVFCVICIIISIFCVGDILVVMTTVTRDVGSHER